jgi:uncharacterized small protein (DUF1192 family)
MDFEDLEPRAKPRVPRDLSGWSVADLEAYIQAMQSEIERARQAISGKQAQKAAADLFFRKPSG